MVGAIQPSLFSRMRCHLYSMNNKNSSEVRRHIRSILITYNEYLHCISDCIYKKMIIVHHRPENMGFFSVSRKHKCSRGNKRASMFVFQLHLEFILVVFIYFLSIILCIILTSDQQEYILPESK